MSEMHGNSSAAARPELAEPKTPLWLTALGGVLFLAVALLWGLS